MAVFAIIVSSQLKNHYPFLHNFHGKIDSPVLAVELSRNAKELEGVLGAASPANAAPKSSPAIAVACLRTNTYEDFVFIPLYTLFLWKFAVLFAIGADGSRMVHRKTIGGLAILIAVFDCAENIGILHALGAYPLTDSMAHTICWPSRCKWGLFAVALLLTAWILARSESPLYSLPTRRLLALAYGTAGFLMLVGLAMPHVIELASAMFALLVAVNIVGLLGPSFEVWFLRPDPPQYVEDFCNRKAQKQVDVAVFKSGTANQL
jgi:hypothetical protein